MLLLCMVLWHDGGSICGGAERKRSIQGRKVRDGKIVVIQSAGLSDRFDKLAGGIKEEDALCQSTGWPSVHALRSHFRFRHYLDRL
jgi:hypothetical protein